MKILQIQCKFQARILPIYCCVQRNFPFFSSFFRYFQENLSKLLHFHFQKNIFGCFSNNFIRFFSIINNNFFQFEDFQLQIFQAFIFSILFWEKYFSEYFFQNNFCQISAPIFSDFWRIKIQYFQPNFLSDCTQRKSIGEVRGIRRTGSSRIHKRSRCFFRLTKLWKKTIWKAAAKENFTNSMQNSSPHFANIMLHEAPFHCFYSNFSSFFRWNSIFQASNSQIFNKIYFSVIFNKVFVNIFSVFQENFNHKIVFD